MLVRVENQAQFGPQYRGVGLVILVTKAGMYRGVKMRCMFQITMLPFVCS